MKLSNNNHLAISYGYLFIIISFILPEIIVPNLIVGTVFLIYGLASLNSYDIAKVTSIIKNIYSVIIPSQVIVFIFTYDNLPLNILYFLTSLVIVVTITILILLYIRKNKLEGDKKDDL